MTDYRELESEAQVLERCPLCLKTITEDGCDCDDEYIERATCGAEDDNKNN